MNRGDTIPPGESKVDPHVNEIDPLAFALDRAWTYLHWVEEHRSSFEAARESESDTAERELLNLANSTHENMFAHCDGELEWTPELLEDVIHGFGVPDPTFAKDARSILTG